MSCMSGSPNLNSFRDRGQVAVQLVSCGVLLPGIVKKEVIQKLHENDTIRFVLNNF